LQQTRNINPATILDKERVVFKMGNLKNDWEQLFRQKKNQSGGSIVCMVNRQTRKRIYFDMELNRVLSKKEALHYSIDLTGQFVVFPRPFED